MENILRILLFLLPATALAQNTAATEFQIFPIRNNVYMIHGDGANIALSVGPDGVLMVDTGTAAYSERLLATVQQLQRQVATNGLSA